MNIELRFLVSGLPADVQAEILSRGEEPVRVYVPYKGLQLLFDDNDHSNLRSLDMDTVLRIYVWHGLNSKILPWLKDVEVDLSLDDKFFGYLDNGIFRHGRAKVVVTTGIDYVESSDNIVATCVNITGKGPAQQVLDQAKKLYRLVRANLLEDKHVVERWPVQASDDLKWLTYGKGAEAEAVPETELPDED